MAITNASRLADFGSGIGTQGATLTINANDQRVGIGTTNPQGTLQVGTGVTIYGNSGIVSATSFVGDLTGNVTGNLTGNVTGDLTGNATGLSGTPDLNINNITGVAATFTGNVSIAGTLTYEDVTNIDSVGLVTARTGIEVSGIVTARAGFAVTYYGDGSGLTGIDVDNRAIAMSIIFGG